VGAGLTEADAPQILAGPKFCQAHLVPFRRRGGNSTAAMEQDLTLREALAADRLDDFVRQKVVMGAELVNGSELERALALLIMT